MRVIHNYRKRLSAIHTFKPSRHLVEMAESCRYLLQGTPSRITGRRGCQQVIDIHLANQPGANTLFAERRDEVKTCLRWLQVDGFSAKIAAVDSVTENLF